MELFLKNANKKPRQKLNFFFSHINIAKLFEDNPKLCDEDLTKKDLYDSLKSMQNDKSPGNNGFINEFYETFWNDLKKIFVDSVSETKQKGHLSTSQRQTIIRLTGKKRYR